MYLIYFVLKYILKKINLKKHSQAKNSVDRYNNELLFENVSKEISNTL